VVTVIRLARVLLTLVLGLVTISSIIGLATPDTGPVEKVVMVALVVGCFVLAAKLATWSTRAQARLTRT
jgi:multisubunit Na+/H+ antiporter MnhB subunit